MGLSSPKQARSKRSLERFLDAAETLLDEQSFDELTIAAICRAADRSVGSFYARFGDKEGLLQELDSRSLEHTLQIARVLTTETLPACSSLYPAVFATVDALARVFGDRPGLMRALILRARIAPNPQMTDRQYAARAVIPGVLEHLLRFRDAMKCAEPEVEIHAAFLYTSYATREALLWDATGRTGRIGRDELVRQLSHFMWASLTALPHGHA